MSLLCRDHRLSRLWAAPAVAVLSSILLSVADAADTYFRPMFTVSGEYDSNRELNPISNSTKSVSGYSATAESIFGVRTPRSESEVRPRIRYQAFPSRKELNRTEGSLDFKTHFVTQRSELNFLGKYFRRDEYNAEFVDVGFDPFDPNSIPPSDGGRAQVSETRSQTDLSPSFIYRWSETMGLGLDLQYQDVRYSADVPLNKQDYDNWQANLYLERRISPKTQISVGGYLGRFKTKDDADMTDTTGASLELAHDWSKQSHSELAVVVERNKAEQRLPIAATKETTDWGVQFSTQRQGELSRLRLVVGRSLVPTGQGGRTSRDEIRTQYDRDISARLTFTATLRAFRQRALSGGDTGIGKTNRDAATGEISLQWSLTPTWYVSGGYGHNWQDIKSEETGSASNNRIFLNLGFRALDPTRRR